MSQSSSAVVRSIYEAFARGDVPAVLGMFAPDIEWNEAENFVYADRSPYRGPQAVLEGVFLRFATEWDGFAAVPDEILDAGDTIVSLGHYRGTCKATGAAVKAQFAHVWRVRDGRVTRFDQYTDTLQFHNASVRPRSAAV